jgi:hypothetical protein
MSDLKLALRTLLKTPFVTTVAILSLALGIGANAAIFSLYEQMVLQQLRVPEPDRLVNFARAASRESRPTSCSAPTSPTATRPATPKGSTCPDRISRC